MANVILRVKREDGSWAEIPALVGPEGPQGVSIDDIVLKSQEGGVSTYSILLSDGSEKTFQVTDGAIITDVSLISTDVLIDTYKISISNGSFFNFKVTNGRGIKSIAKTSTDVLSDTYTISYNDNTSSTFKVANGRSITKIVKSNTDVLTDTYTISYNDNTTSTYTVTNGRGIDYIEKDETIGLRDRYTIHYNDGSTSSYYVTNGETGPEGGIGNRIYLSGLVDKVDDEKGYGRVKELKESDFDLSKFTVVGSPLISENGIASGFSSGNYLTIPYDWAKNVTNFKIKGKFKVENSVQGTNFILGYVTDGYAMGLSFSSTAINWFAIKTSSENVSLYQRYSITPNIDYSYELQLNNNLYTFRLFDDTGSAVVNLSKSTNSPFSITSSYLRLGTSGNYNPSNFMAGSIDLKSTSITVDGKEVFNGNKTGLDVIKPDNYTVVGSPVISEDGVASGLSQNNRLEIPFNSTGKTNFKIKVPFKFPTTMALGGNIIWGDIGIGSYCYGTKSYQPSLLGTGVTAFAGSEDLQANIDYILEMSVENTNSCKFEIKRIDTNVVVATKSWTTERSVEISKIYISQLSNLVIDLNAFKIYVDGNLVYQPCLKIPYTLSKTGSKIVDVAYRDRVEDCYNQYGAGNYYLFSNATEQFALPMPDIYGLIESLLDITPIEGADW